MNLWLSFSTPDIRGTGLFLSATAGIPEIPVNPIDFRANIQINYEEENGERPATAGHFMIEYIA